jgi:hypothetical protein
MDQRTGRGQISQYIMGKLLPSNTRKRSGVGFRILEVRFYNIVSVVDNANKEIRRHSC